MTLNIWNYNPPWERRRELIAEAVEQGDPDVVGFQEIRHDGQRNVDGQNQAQQLAALLPGYRFIYRPAQRDPGEDRWEGLAMFSRLPLASSSAVRLSRDPDDGRDNHQRIALHAELAVGGSRLHVIDTHLSLSRKGRSRTVRELVAFAGRYAGDSPVVLLGDFNEAPEGEPIQYITGQGGYVDAWDHRHPGEPGWTFTGENAYVQAKHSGAEVQGRRIDYIFVRSPSAGGAGICDCRVVANRRAVDGEFPSDHFGLLADIEWLG